MFRNVPKQFVLGNWQIWGAILLGAFGVSEQTLLKISHGVCRITVLRWQWFTNLLFHAAIHAAATLQASLANQTCIDLMLICLTMLATIAMLFQAATAPLVM